VATAASLCQHITHCCFDGCLPTEQHGWVNVALKQQQK
jgi:hypothetical protein